MPIVSHSQTPGSRRVASSWGPLAEQGGATKAELSRLTQKRGATPPGVGCWPARPANGAKREGGGTSEAFKDSDPVCFSIVVAGVIADQPCQLASSRPRAWFTPSRRLARLRPAGRARAPVSSYSGLVALAAIGKPGPTFSRTASPGSASVDASAARRCQRCWQLVRAPPGFCDWRHQDRAQASGLIRALQPA